jgi:hypothetical protein
MVMGQGGRAQAGKGPDAGLLAAGDAPRWECQVHAERVARAEPGADRNRVWARNPRGGAG